MTDLHTHTILSDGELLPSELVRRAAFVGYSTIALTDHADSSNIDFVLPRLVKVCRELNRFWKIRALPGVEITHVPIELFRPLVRYARSHGAKVVVGHGETISEPVLPGTNTSAIKAGIDILAHPGFIKKSDILLAKKKGVCLEITTRKSHAHTNKYLVRTALPLGARLIINTDSHSHEDLVSKKRAGTFLKRLGLKKPAIAKIFKNSASLVKKSNSVRN